MLVYASYRHILTQISMKLDILVDSMRKQLTQLSRVIREFSIRNYKL